MSRSFSISAILAAGALCAALLGGCATTQKIPVSTDPSGAAVYLDGVQVCTSTPCSVEMSTDQNHLLTILMTGYGQKDIPVRPTSASGGGQALTPGIVTVRMYKPGELDVRDTDRVVDTAVGLGMGVLKRVLEDAAKNSGQGSGHGSGQNLGPEAAPDK
ncbi:MAG: PEGA domain-containing protein [Proteobacteria bacterium]|nr:PEGA domain-containing protein [Pseudomonadota bacterium]